MAKMFFKKEHLKYFYLCIIIYLYGDLTIYSTAISKSLRDVTCSYDNCNKTELDASDPCWESLSISRGAVYRLYILIIALFLGPFFNLHTKYLQLLTSIFRWLGKCNSCSSLKELQIKLVHFSLHQHDHSRLYRTGRRQRRRSSA